MNAALSRTVSIIVGGLLLLGLVVGLFVQNQSLDWGRSYETPDQAPFGTYLLYEQMGSLFPGAITQDVNRSAFDKLVFQPDRSGLYIFINDELPFYQESSRELLDFVRRGNQAFLAAYALPAGLESTLGISGLPLNMMGVFRSVQGGLNSRDSLQLLIDGHRFPFPEKDAGTFWDLSQEGPQRIEVLGTDGRDRPNFVKVRYGEGAFFLFSQPNVLSNYYLMDPQRRDYLARVMGKLAQVDTVYWDQFYKKSKLRFRSNSRDQQAGGDENPERPNLLAYMLQQPGLNWGLSLALLGVILFAFFEGKRKQRVIPVVNPLPNSTLDFSETIGRLYFQYRDHHNIAEKRSRVWMDYLRQRYYLSSHELNEEFVQAVAGKTGLEIGLLRQLTRMVIRIRESDTFTESELIAFNDLLETFYGEERR